MKPISRTALAALAAISILGALTTISPAGAADPAVTLRAATALPASSAYTRGFLAFVHDVNERGKKKFRIEIVDGGANGLGAVRDGRIDMSFGPITDHASLVPEASAISASETKAKELRANGGMALIDQIYRAGAKTRFLGMLNSGARLHLYLKDAPRMTDDLPNLADMRIAGDKIYREFVSSLGAEPVSAAFPAALDALRDGKADGIIWPRVGLQQAFRDKRLVYRIDPGFSQIVTGVVMNLQRWNRLTRAHRELLDKTMIEHERTSYTAMRVASGEADEALELAGLRVISIKGDEGKSFTARTTENAWAVLKHNHPGYAAQLEHVFYRERTPQ
ncbi:MAG: TRAP transporter substrate-binding protein DctP [Rhodospirillales bacterium]|nr:TRAP transporter substrate-binding protein DctP [Rhodospirillales bacterium]